MSKDANSFGHDKALAWESRGFVYTKRGCIVSTHPLSFASMWCDNASLVLLGGVVFFYLKALTGICLLSSYGLFVI